MATDLEERDAHVPPERPGRLSSPVLVGREPELAQLLQAVASSPSVAVVEGEAGVGKTRLVRELLGHQDIATRRSYVGRFYELREPFPLGAVVDALREAVLPSNLPAIMGALRPLLPELEARLPALPPALADPAAEQHRTFRALRELLGRLGPSVVVLEDLHWADQTSMDLLRFLAPQLPDNVALVCTYRREDLGDGGLPALDVRLPSEIASVRVTLGPLQEGEVRELVAQILEASYVSDQFAAYLFERTAGLPFAVEEVLLLLKQRHDLVRVHGEWVRHELEALGVPVELRDSILQRFERLGPEARQIVRAAAVLSAPAEAELLCQVSDLDDNAGAEALSETLASALLLEVEDGRYGFRHALACQAIEDGVPRPTLQRLHLRAARVLEALAEKPVARLAHHYRAAGETSAWLGYAEAAADQAVTLNDHASAYHFLREALSIPDLSAERRGRLAVRVGRHALATSAHEEAIELVRSVLAEDSLSRELRGELRFSSLVPLLWESGETSAAMTEAVEAIDELPPGLAARAMATVAAAPTTTPMDVRLQYLDRAARLAPEIRDEALTVAIAVDRATTLISFGDPEGRRSIDKICWPDVTSCTAQELAELVRGYANIADALLHVGHYRRSEVFVRKGLELAATYWPPKIPMLKQTSLELRWLAGDWNGLEEEVRQHSEELRHLSATSHQAMEALLGQLLLVRGNLGAAERTLRAVTENFFGDLPALTWAAAGLARLRLAAGDPEGAVQETMIAVAALAERGSWAWGAELLPLAVEALLASSDRAGAAELAEVFGQGLLGRDAPAASAACAVCLGHVAAMDGDTANALSSYGEAEESWWALGRPYEAARAHRAAGHCHLDGGSSEEGQAVLVDALRRYVELGAIWDSDALRSELRGHGIAFPHRRGRKGYGPEPSPRELQVAGLKAEGLSNRQIAEALFLSVKTVEGHQTTIRKKLGLASSAEFRQWLGALNADVPPVSPRQTRRTG